VCTTVAVDLGGTHIRAARFSSAVPIPDAQTKIPTHASEGPEAVVARIVEAITAVLPPSQSALRIGIGAPGPLDPAAGTILEAPNLPGFLDFPLRDRIRSHFDCPVALGNDANLAALAEWRFGAGRGTDHMLYLTISTGIGGGIISDGRLLVGARGLAAELGHMTVQPDGPRCGCGRPGHLEAVAAGPAIARRAAARVEAGERSSLATARNRITAADVGRAALDGDALAAEVVAEAAEAIGAHLADLAHAFNPEVIVIGGGVAQIGDLLFNGIDRALQDHLMHPAYAEGLRILPAQLGDDAGLVGAMVLACDL
jgi:glucokinase